MTPNIIIKLLRNLSVFVLTSLLLISGAQAQKSEQEQAALATLDALFPGKIINNPFKVKWKNQGGVKKTVKVPQIPGQKAREIKVTTAQADAWKVEINAPLGASISRGDMILLAFWARAEEVNPETGKGKILVRLGRNKEPWDTIISEVVNPTEDWRLYYLKAIANTAMNKKQLNMFFQVGDLAQTVQIGQVYVTNSGPDGDFDSIPQGSQDLITGEFEDSSRSFTNDRTLPVPRQPPEGPDFHPQDAGWSLVWSDEFSGDSLDSSKWKPEVSCWGGGNKELQCYTESTKNVQVRNGQLRLIALAEEVEGPINPPELRETSGTRKQPFSSGKVRTRGIADWKYGRFEMRAKLPAGQGTWPAFWMLPIDEVYGSWPLSGEIDIMESVNLGASCPVCPAGTEDRSSSALHFGDKAPKNKLVEHRTRLGRNDSPSDNFHVWAAEWGEGRINFYLDGKMHFSTTQKDWFTASPSAKGKKYAPFDQNFYLMLNLAIGGDYPEALNDAGVASDVAPVEFLIDWVRVYQCESDIETGLACMK